MRLNQFLARAGYGSRRACETLITDGQVTINGRRVTQLATTVGSNDAVKVGSKLILTERPLTAVLHKPVGVLCSTTDPGARKTIYDFLPRDWPRVFYVGRLDYDSEGLLLITNDGDLSQRLTHPSYKLPKTYEVILDKEFDFSLVEKLQKGLTIEGQRGRFDDVYRLGPKIIKVILTQGLKRQIRQMLNMVGYEVKRLIRTKVGTLTLGDLKPGEFRILSETEIKKHFSPAAATSRPPRPFPSTNRPSRSPRPSRD
jgi:23S rRNA pseudouridine2605 synthase